ncbi:MAG: hypothetical protein J6V00_05390 [Bacteroidaceae bacterium]|nr:hypothetical protein [Bacteroidaceae bacterium]
MTFTLNVNIGLSPQLAGFLSAILGSQPQTAQPIEAREQVSNFSVDAVKPAQVAAVKPAQVAAVEPATEVTPEPATAETALEEREYTPPTIVPVATPPTAAEEPSTAVEEEREYTEADVRAAIDRARCRIEGNDWKDNPDGEGYKKWHRAMTSWFKVTAALFGADRPSELPDSRSRMNFIRCCDDVEISNGALVEAVPF